jgi:phosphohistidine phosphatase
VAGKTLIVLRHGKSSWKTNDADFHRPLAGRGVRDAQAAGKILAEYHIDYVLCSAATRAKQTWENAKAGGATAEEIDYSEAIYHAWSNEILDELHDLDESIHTALVIGHQPTLGDLIETLAKPNDLLARVEAKFPTSGLAVLTYRGGWKTLGPGKATLARFEIPRG